MLRRIWRVELPLAALAVAGIIAVVLIGVVTLLLLREAGTKHELHRVERQTVMAGEAVVEPLITPALLRGDPAALAALDRAVRRHVLHDPVVRVKLWMPNGRIVYSDEKELIGERFHLHEDELALLSSGQKATSSLSDLDAPENQFEQGEDELLEVYTRVAGPEGPLLFETYQRFEYIAANSRDLWLSLLPALLAGLVLLELANLAIARWFARRLRRADQQRVALLAKARDASSRERRRIAADLHDGVVQDLTAASLAVGGAARALDEEEEVSATTISALDEAADTMRESVGTLRTLLMDFYPADLEARGLADSLGDLAALARTRGALTEIDVPPHLPAPLDTQALLYRVAQEAVRNAVTHSRADRVSVRAGRENGHDWLEVQDDGEGFDPVMPAPEGHIGLRSLRDLVSDAGGRFVVRSSPGEGCVVRAEIPVV